VICSEIVKCQNTRAYVKEAGRASGDMSDDLSWALGYADRVDPLVETEEIID